MAERESSGAALGFGVFAAVMMWWIGFFHGMAGLAAILDDDVFVRTRSYVFQFDLTTWGWIHLVLGIVVIFAGFAVLRGALWGRVVGIALAVISAIANFGFVPYEPVWALLIIGVDLAVIWALSVHGREIARR